MAGSFNRRRFLQGAAVNVVRLGSAVALAGVARKGLDLLDLHDTWDEAALPNSHLLSAHTGRLANLRLGGSFAPEEWSTDRNGSNEARRALEVAIKELDLRQMRLGLRWSRSVNREGRVDLRAYRPYLDYCFANDVEVCLNVGPIRTFRWPEEHVPGSVRASTALPRAGATIGLDDGLTRIGLQYLDELIETLKREYGPALDAVRIVQIENEPFYPLGEHEWIMGFDYLSELARRVDDAFPDKSLLVTSAGRLHLHDVRDLLVALLAERPALAGRLISGFDYHYKTPLRDSVPVVRHFDQVAYARPFAPSLEGNLQDARAIGYDIEVTEGQAEPYGQLTEPGNSAKDFRFLILRCLDKVLDPAGPGLIRMWGVEGLAMKMLRGQLSDEHRQIIELIQTINDSPAREAPQARTRELF